jgi:hypothetical protein
MIKKSANEITVPHEFLPYFCKKFLDGKYFIFHNEDEYFCCKIQETRDMNLKKILISDIERIFCLIFNTLEFLVKNHFFHDEDFISEELKDNENRIIINQNYHLNMKNFEKTLKKENIFANTNEDVFFNNLILENLSIEILKIEIFEELDKKIFKESENEIFTNKTSLIQKTNHDSKKISKEKVYIYELEKISFLARKNNSHNISLTFLNKIMIMYRPEFNLVNFLMIPTRKKFNISLPVVSTITIMFSILNILDKNNAFQFSNRIHITNVSDVYFISGFFNHLYYEERKIYFPLVHPFFMNHEYPPRKLTNEEKEKSLKANWKTFLENFLKKFSNGITNFEFDENMITFMKISN